VPQIAVKIYTLRVLRSAQIFVNTRAKRRNNLKSSIARKSFTGATFETIRKILQTSENPAFSQAVECHKLRGKFIRSVSTVSANFCDGKSEIANELRALGTPRVTRLRPKRGSTLRLVTRVLGLPQLAHKCQKMSRPL
jgi:hypothetical protein